MTTELIPEKKITELGKTAQIMLEEWVAEQLVEVLLQDCAEGTDYIFIFKEVPE